MSLVWHHLTQAWWYEARHHQPCRVEKFDLSLLYGPLYTAPSPTTSTGFNMVSTGLNQILRTRSTWYARAHHRIGMRTHRFTLGKEAAANFLSCWLLGMWAWSLSEVFFGPRWVAWVCLCLDCAGSFGGVLQTSAGSSDRSCVRGCAGSVSGGGMM